MTSGAQKDMVPSRRVQMPYPTSLCEVTHQS